MQLAAIRDYVRKREWQVAIDIRDIDSGASVRPQREELLQAAHRREIDLECWSVGWTARSET